MTAALALVPESRGQVLRSDAVAREAVRLVVIPRAGGAATLTAFGALPTLLRAGDLVVVNDAATLPAALVGRTATGAPFELRLTAPPAGALLRGFVLGAGDHHVRTEDRGPAPPLEVGDRAWFGALLTTVIERRGREIAVRAEREGDALWQALYAVGKPIQYAHRDGTLPLWSVQTAYAARPWAVEMPSAGRPLTWQVLLDLRRAGIVLATLTHAAGVSSTGDAALDRALPLPERYDIPATTIAAIRATRARGGRVIAVGTSVVRALEASALTAGPGVATLRLDATSRLAVVDGLISGLHVPGESHFDLLSAFTTPAQLDAALALAAAHGLSAHELGDVCLVI